jgi:hypothetical protein
MAGASAIIVFLSLFFGVVSSKIESSPKRRVVQWLVPYVNLTTTAEYVQIWAQLKPNHRSGQNLYAASAYALKENNASLGYATTPAGEAYDGFQMEQLGMPALRSLGLEDGLIGMVYVTHFSAIATMLKNTSLFIGQLLAKAEEQNLQGFDIDYEPQQVALAEQENFANGRANSASSTFMEFIKDLAFALNKVNKILTVDISGCPDSFSFHCAGVANMSSLPGLALVNCEDSFGAGSLDGLKQLQQSDGVSSALGTRWAPGWEPNNIGPTAFQEALAYLSSSDACTAAGGVCPMAISTWAVHEWYASEQPQWLFDAINAFLDAPVPT